jgi:adenosylcobyric acid synthase
LKERQLDRLADAVAEHLDTDQLSSLIQAGSPQGLPFIPPGAPR